MKKLSGFARIRIAVLSSILLLVILYALHDVLRRRERSSWERTLDVALVLVDDGALRPSAFAAARARVPELSARLAAAFAHYRKHAARPFSFTVYGPVDLGVPPPRADEEGLLASVRYAWALHRFTSDVDGRAAVPSRGFDSRVYLVARAASAHSLVEGASEFGGRVGIAWAELDEQSADIALFVAAHELFHTLGANDRYGPDGRTSLPAGLAEPELDPLYPQRYAELMARNRPLSESAERRPESLDELWVGPVTAREIGWLEPTR